ncbi:MULTISPECIES: hypothetical protein [Amycolatopsis]|uniref:Uncharacterized protein n=2 Tax=Amycolatopsis TaxID=1813 RepID=A0A2N3WFD1_9PSEU|nr:MULTISPECIES: hypothetical protein [Amycolatopsis]MBB2499465.1 hypothetical protein [Amycolatopsis echigonensis]PKV92588.1 hypothetical protein ATK30_3408 [Amycolatopsis niigatensis]TVT17372.1 hypothetical protein FNH06_31570 [Amycolatopsis acidiphila]UIJ59838.1 hypothetical protein LWP59_38650 [Amycolatopsis acidiphila]GHG62902.1 hypothetical protein GCM10017788_18900 [Amycolatopsis acidiphila]
MSEFVTVLRGRVQGAQQKLATAREAGHDYEIYLHIARIKDLLDLAERHGIDTTDWIDPAELTTTEARG